MIAEETNGGVKVFPNLARQIRTYARMPAELGEKSSGMGEVLVPGAAEIVKDITQIVRAELVAAGIPGEMDKEGRIGCYDLALGGLDWVKGEVPTGLVGFFNKWKFERRWYYYAAEGAGIPPEFAVPFDKEWGKEARVNGDCACRGAEFWGEGFAISNYHIDTPQGLKAFVELLAKIYAPRREGG
jgi:hypothetical protein